MTNPPPASTSGAIITVVVMSVLLVLGVGGFIILLLKRSANKICEINTEMRSARDELPISTEYGHIDAVNMPQRNSRYANVLSDQAKDDNEDHYAEVGAL